MTPDEKKLNSYYLNKFGWTWVEVEALFKRQNNCCYICHRPPGDRRMAVDHDHAYDRVKIRARKMTDGRWAVGADEPQLNVLIEFYGHDKKALRKMVRLSLRARSVRGRLCMRCNKGIQMFEDSKAPLTPAERFDRAAKYFRNFRSLSEQAKIETPQNPPLQTT